MRCQVFYPDELTISLEPCLLKADGGLNGVVRFDLQRSGEHIDFSPTPAYRSLRIRCTASEWNGQAGKTQSSIFIYLVYSARPVGRNDCIGVYFLPTGPCGSVAQHPNGMDRQAWAILITLAVRANSRSPLRPTPYALLLTPNSLRLTLYALRLTLYALLLTLYALMRL